MSAVQLPFELDQHQFINTTTINLSPNLTVKNIASYKLTHRLAARELVGLPGYFTNVEFPSTNRELSEEIQLQGAAFDDQLSWVAGIFYMQTHIDTASPGMYFGYSTRVVSAHSQTAAAFAQGTYNLPWVDGLALTLGARYTADDRKLTTSAFRGSATTCSLRVGGVAPTPCAHTDKKSFGQWTYNATLNYQIDPDTLVYAIHSRGYRAGGLNGADPNFETFTIGYKPETNKNYEIGLKRDWDLGFPLRTNLAGYIQKYTNVVRQLYPQSTSGNTVQLLINGPKADILGTEVEVRARPIDDLELNLSYAYVNAHYTADWQPILGLQGRDLRFSLVPATQFNISATYTLPIINPDHGEVSFNVHFSHQSRMWGDDVQQPPYYPAVGTMNDLSQKPYSLLNMRVDWKSVMGSNFDLDVWVKNLANTKYYTAFNPSATSGMLAGYNGQPRFVGFDVKYRFGAAAD